MGMTYWVALVLSLASLLICVASALMSKSRHERMRYTDTQMMIAYLKGYEDSVMGRKCDRKRAFDAEVDE